MKRITINPITRLEGHAKIEIFLNDEGSVENAYFQVPELRGFEKFCEGRPVEELPRITPRICGVCPGAHHLASTKAADEVFGVEPTSTAKKLRELFYCAHYIHSHTLHFYFLGGPDFVVGPKAELKKRNILGVIEKVGEGTAKEVIKHRAYAQRIQEIIGGKATHPVMGLPGGVSKRISGKERAEIEKMAESCVKFAKFSLKVFTDIVLSNKDYVDLILNPAYTLKTHYMGLVDEEKRVNFYDGRIRVVDAEGAQLYCFLPADYLEYIAEKTESWTYLKFPYLKKVGWRGLSEDPENGIYRVAPLARANCADGMATSGAQSEYERMFETLGKKPLHNTLANHWARLVELLYSAERALELARDPEITSDDIRNIPTEVRGEGIGVVEAPRGTLFHHYITDKNGIVEKVNLIVATGNNNAAICLSIKKAAESLIREAKVDEGLLNMIEMAFRAYDPCYACATHSIVGKMPMVVNIYKDGELIKRLER
jgi:F420-non-reducing hydrogenase large subunit